MTLTQETLNLQIKVINTFVIEIFIALIKKFDKHMVPYKIFRLTSGDLQVECRGSCLILSGK
jgi:hypothetical protein